MALQQLKPAQRIVFLKKFTKELLINSVEEEIRKKNIEIEKLKQKIAQPIEGEKFREMSKQEFKPSPQRLETRKPILHRTKTPIRKPFKRLAQTTQLPPLKSIQPPPISPKTQQVLAEVKPVANPTPPGFNLGKIEQLLKDPSVQSIECPGPNKKVLIKRNYRINTIKIGLTQEEITEIINTFSQQAKIPVMGGILKAAVGSLVISAVISDFVGSRFIINRIPTYPIAR